MKLKKHAPSVKYHTRSTITEMGTINRVKIISMTIYHTTRDRVKRFCNNFTILCFSLYHDKAIKKESDFTPSPPRGVGQSGRKK